jgi:hypothetical protein
MQLSKLLTARNLLIVVLIWIVGALALYGTSGLKESFWTIDSPAPYLAEPTGPHKSDIGGFLLSDNASSPEQCKKGSSYSTSGGCVILTEEQKRLINTRGGNRTMESDTNSF